MSPIKKLKLMPLIVACVLFVLGVIVIFISDVVGNNMPVIFGTIILGIGIVRVVYGFLTYRQEEDARHNITLGVLDIIWGIVMLVLLNKEDAFSVMFGIWCLIGAVLEFAEMAREVLAKKPWIGLLVDAVVNLCFGIVLMASKWVLDATFNRFAGIYLLLNAFSTILITLLSIKREEVAVATQLVEAKPEPVAEVKVEEVKAEPAAPVAEEKAEVEAKPAAKKAPAKKSTTTKSTTTKSTAAKKPAATKSTATKTTTAKKTGTKTTTTKKTTTAKKSTPKAE